MMNNRYRSSSRPEMLAFIPPRRSTILEIGCGEGRFAASIPGARETWGVEPDAAAAGMASGRMSRVLNGTFEHVRESLPRSYFDVIVCNDVIEHMIDHDAFLSQAKLLLSAGGCLVASIPNVRYYVNLFELLVCQDWEYRDAGILDRTHLRFFTRRSLRRALTQNGYVIDVLQGINGGIRFGWDRWRFAAWLTAWTAVGLSLGSFSDIKYMQFAIRASAAP